MDSNVCLHLVHIFLSAVVVVATPRIRDADCLTADGSVGFCTPSANCPSSFLGVKTVLCRYHQGYGDRICCPHSFSSRYTQRRDDLFSDGQPINFPSEPLYNPLVRPTTSGYNPYYSPESDSQPSYHNRPSYNNRPIETNYDSSSYNSRPNVGDYNRPSYNNRPNVGNYDRPSYEEDRPSYNRPDYPSNPSYSTQERPHSLNRPTFSDQNKPNYEDTIKPAYGDQGRPHSNNGFQTTQSGSSYNQRPDNNRPGLWGDASEYQPGRRTTPRPSWEIEDSTKVTTPRRRISEEKCDEYSRPVFETIGVLPLSIDSDAVPLMIQKCQYSAIQLIVGGESAGVGEFPHMAVLGFQSPGSRTVMWNCGGSLISERYVMTAGHCVNTSFGDPVVVRLGEHNLERDNDGAEPADYNVERVILHPNYVKSLKYNDIALIRLSRTVRFNRCVRPACLPIDDYIRGKPTATGWGRTDYVGKLSDILMKVSLSVIDNRQCNSFYSSRNPASSTFPRGIVDTMMCAGELQGGKDTCLGDSGGPLTVTRKDNPCIHYVVGITSFGKVCGAANSPGVYTKVSKYISWIERTVWP